MKKVMPFAFTILFFLLLELILAGINLVIPLDIITHRVAVRHSKFIINLEYGRYAHFYRDPDLFWRMKCNWGEDGLRVNSLGFRGPETTVDKSEDVIRIICLGNSCTFASDVEDFSRIYTTRLWSMLTEKYPQKHFEVINAGVDGYSTHQILQYWNKKIVTLDPDIITIYAAFNDLVYAPLKKDREIELSGLFCSISNLLFSSRVIRTLNAVIALIIKTVNSNELVTNFNAEKGILRRVEPDEYADNLSELYESATQKNVNVVFITSPYWKPLPICILPYPNKVVNKDKLKVHWVVQDQIGKGWGDRLRSIEDYEAELDKAISLMKEWPEWPAPHYKAAMCYQKLGEFSIAKKHFAAAESLDVTRHDLEAYNQIMKDLSQKFDIPLVDCEEIFCRGTNVDLFIGDGIHPNADGHALIAEELFRTIDGMIKK